MMSEDMKKMQDMFLELKIELAKTREKCDNVEERLALLEKNEKGSGIYLDGVAEVYRKVIVEELTK
jgi:chromosome segregation and condensation protein ScpB